MSNFTLTPSMNQERPPELLVGSSGDMQKINHLNCSYSCQNLYTVSILYDKTITNVKVDLDSNQECPPRVLGGGCGDMEETITLYCSRSLQNSNTVSIWYKETITYVIIHFDSNQEPGTSSQTPLRMFWIHGRDNQLVLLLYL